MCGFNSETWNGAATVWDQPIDWPTVPMTAGPRNFVWNISWGPHFSDTEEFRYWITRPGFVWQTGRALSFTDFEDTPFCDADLQRREPERQSQRDSEPGRRHLHRRAARCPQRSGRHVIYAEWGRNFFTFERFHGCIDAQFSGTPPPTVTANIALNPNVTTFTGSGSIRSTAAPRSAATSRYSWSVDSENPGAVHHHQPDGRAWRR